MKTVMDRASNEHKDASADSARTLYCESQKEQSVLHAAQFASTHAFSASRYCDSASLSSRHTQSGVAGRLRATAQRAASRLAAAARSLRSARASRHCEWPSAGLSVVTGSDGFMALSIRQRDTTCAQCYFPECKVATFVMRSVPSVCLRYIKDVDPRHTFPNARAWCACDRGTEHSAFVRGPTAR
jgi:hypothetical protein